MLPASPNTENPSANTEVVDVDIENDDYTGKEVVEIIDDDDDDEMDDIEEELPKKVATPAAGSTGLPADDFEGNALQLFKPIPDYPVKDLAHFVWEIKDWNSLREDKVRSPRFSCGGYEWNILLFPHGNNNNNFISLYMEPQTINDSDPDWYVCAQFGLDIWNPNHPEAHLPSGSLHRFNKKETDWGFSSLIDIRQLASANNPRTGNVPYPILENNQVNITGYIKVIDDSSTGVLWHSFMDYDSKKATGYVGLNNQGATCYLNSLLQSYFTTKIFRKLVYQIPTSTVSSSEVSVPLALQRIFYLLSSSNDPVGTMELTKSFGWDSLDAFTQHDVQELNRILMDKLEIAMKGSPIENSLNDIFVGKMKSYIRCVNVPYESSRVEDFWDIQLNVKGFKNLQESFKNYIEIEMLDGENKYQAGDEHGYQDAKKGVVFQSFPPVLHLQLKRFEYDFMVDDLVKIDDLCEFPDKIDLKPYLDEDLDPEQRNQDWNYKLHGVLVHQGSISNGHYYAMIKPNSDDSTWLRYDDDKVWKVTPTQVFQENFGANILTQEQVSKLSRLEQLENLIRRVTSAYMLVYYRESELKTILPRDEASIDSVIPDHIPNQIKYENEERIRQEKVKQEALYYTKVKLITTSRFNNFTGFDLALDSTQSKFYDELLVGTPCDPIYIKAKKDDPFSSLASEIAVELGYAKSDLDVAEKKHPFRLIVTSHRNNHTNRADTPVSEEVATGSIISVYFKSFNRKYDEMVFYVEELNKEMHNINALFPSLSVIDPANFKFDTVLDKIEQAKDVAETSEVAKEFKFSNIEDHDNDLLIFVKYFDPISQQTRGLTHIVVSKDDRIESIIKPINKFLNFKEDLNIELYEELSPSKIERIDPTLTFEKHELSNGDIITVQPLNVVELAGDSKFKDLREYYRFLFTRIHIVVKPFKADIDEEDSDFVAEDGDDAKNTNGLLIDSKNGLVQVDDVITNKEIEAAKQISTSFDLWVSSLASYQELAQEIVNQFDTKIDPSYLRIFVLNHQGSRYPLKTHHHLSQLFPKPVPISQIVSFEYEVLNIKLKDYENLKSVKIHWLSSLLQYQVFELLVPKNGLVSDLLVKLLHKVNVPKKLQKHLLVWSGNNNTYYDLLKFDKPLESIQDGLQLYTGIFPVEVEILSSHDMIKRYENEPVDIEEFEDEVLKQEFIIAKQFSKSLNLIPAFHFYKNSTYHHGIPFILPVYPEETFGQTKERLRRKLGLGIQAFEKIRFALADSHDKGAYIDHDNNDLILFDEIGKSQSSVSFALDHPDRAPRRQNQFDKGISIK